MALSLQAHSSSCCFCKKQKQAVGSKYILEVHISIKDICSRLFFANIKYNLTGFHHLSLEISLALYILLRHTYLYILFIYFFLFSELSYFDVLLLYNTTTIMSQVLNLSSVANWLGEQLEDKDGFVPKTMLCLPIYNGQRDVIGVAQLINKVSFWLQLLFVSSSRSRFPPSTNGFNIVSNQATVVTYIMDCRYSKHYYNNIILLVLQFLKKIMLLIKNWTF